MSVSPFSVLKSTTSNSGAQRCAFALIISGQKKPRGERSPYERPLTLKRNQICNQHSRKTARFTSSKTKFQNDAVRFSGRCALRAGISPLTFDGRLSSTPLSQGNFIRTMVTEVRILECARWCDLQAWLNLPLRKV